MRADYRIEIFYSKEDGGFIANIPELEMCSAFGETPQEALSEVLVAKTIWLETAQEEGRRIPKPKTTLKSKLVPV